METIDISFDLTSSDYTCGLGFEIFHNHKQILNIEHVASDTPVAFTLDAEEGDQELKFIMKNKTIDHTTVDEDGQIVKDARLNICNFYIDNLELGHTFLEQCKYYHDFNGTKDPVVDEFYGDMGCNGTLTFSFQSPVYMWLIMNM